MKNKNIPVDKIVEICENTAISMGTASTVKTFCSDTRKIKKDDLFISFKSEINNNQIQQELIIELIKRKIVLGDFESTN